MPKKRTTRGTAARSRDSKTEKVHLTARDFDAWFEKQMALLHNIVKDAEKHANYIFEYQMSKLPKSVLDMRYEDFLACDCNISKALDFLNSSAEITNDEELLKSVGKAHKKPVNMSSTVSTNFAEPKTRARVKKTLNMSTRELPTSRFDTPAITRDGVDYTDTPLVTPAFDPRLLQIFPDPVEIRINLQTHRNRIMSVFVAISKYFKGLNLTEGEKILYHEVLKINEKYSKYD